MGETLALHDEAPHSITNLYYIGKFFSSVFYDPVSTHLQLSRFKRSLPYSYQRSCYYYNHLKIIFLATANIPCYDCTLQLTSINTSTRGHGATRRGASGPTRILRGGNDIINGIINTHLHNYVVTLDDSC